MSGYDAYGAYGTAAPNDPYAAAAGGYGHPAYAPPAPFGGYHAAPAAYGAPPAAYGGIEEVRTIFITGFPNDVKERELNNLLRFLPGYEASQMNWNKGQAQGFALFSTGAYARAACDALQHVTFDETSTLRCEVARKNMYIKDDPNKRARMGPPPPVAGYGYPPSGGAAPYRSAAPAAASYAPVSNTGDNPPCNTLFVGNLSDQIDEMELRNLFAGQAGFRNFKLMRGARATSAFVEFEDVSTAMGAHTALQGAMLNSSDRGGIRVQFSKNPFGKKRDITGALIDTPVRELSSGPSGGYGAAPGGQGGYSVPSDAGAGGEHGAAPAAAPAPEEYQPTAF